MAPIFIYMSNEKGTINTNSQLKQDETFFNNPNENVDNIHI